MKSKWIFICAAVFIVGFVLGYLVPKGYRDRYVLSDCNIGAEEARSYIPFLLDKWTGRVSVFSIANGKKFVEIETFVKQNQTKSNPAGN